MREVCIVGVGFSSWGEVWRQSLRSLYVDAAQAAIRQAGVDHVDSLYVGCMSGGLFVGQEHLGPLMADYLGMRGVPAAHVESACASGGLAVRQAFLEVASGVSEIVLAGGVEKMTDCTGDAATAALATAADQEYEVFNGATFPGLYAMMAHAHMHRYNSSRDALSAVAVKNHHNGSMNPVAQYQFEITMEQVANSVLVADPLRVLDCSGITDGAACVIVTSLEVAKRLGRPYVRITGSAVATDTIALAQRPDFTSIASAKLASQRALGMAKRELKEMKFAEVQHSLRSLRVTLTAPARRLWPVRRPWTGGFPSIRRAGSRRRATRWAPPGWRRWLKRTSSSRGRPKADVRSKAIPKSGCATTWEAQGPPR